VSVPAECAIKVFKTTLNEFKTRNHYIREDFRFRDRLGKQNHRNTINLWAEKEMHNLQRSERVLPSFPPR
jgi:RIO kinase 3